MPSRRAFLAGIGAAVIGSSTTASAERTPNLPGHITNVGDEIDELRKFQPLLVTTRAIRQRMLDMYGWYADSSEYDTRAYYFWQKHTHQEGFLERWTPWDKDAHFGDHEPVIQFVDMSTGEVTDTVYSNYHHFVAELQAANANLQEYAVDGEETHITLEVSPDHQHYWHYPEGDRGAPVENLTDLRSFLEVRDNWYDDDIFEKTNHDAIDDPWFVLEEAESWWDESTLDYQAGRIWYSLGFRGAENTDEGVRIRSFLPF